MRQRNSAADTVPEAVWRHKTRRWSLRGRGPTTICYAGLCRYAEGCPSRTARPRRIALEKCARYWPEEIRPPASSSRLIRGLVASYQALPSRVMNPDKSGRPSP